MTQEVYSAIHVGSHW